MELSPFTNFSTPWSGHDLFGPSMLQRARTSGCPVFAGVTPKCNYLTTEKTHQFHVDLPGMTKENVTVRVKNGNTLVITGERKHEKETKREDWVRTESSFGKFERSWTLPDDTIVDQVNAKFKDGVLTVSFPRKGKETETPSVKVDVE